MLYACSPRLPARPSPIMRCARSLEPRLPAGSSRSHLLTCSQVEIDQINKPFLPVAAGRISPKLAWALVVGSGALCQPGLRRAPASDPGLPQHTVSALTLCRCGGPGGGQGGLHPAHLLAVPLRHHRRWPVFRAPLPGKPRPPRPRSLPPSPVCRLPAPCTLPHAPAAACGVVCRLRCLPLAV